MRGYPIFVDLQGRSCLVVGGGAVGAAKARSLVDAGACVDIVDPEPSPSLQELAAQHQTITIERRVFVTGDCDGRALVFACTGNTDTDRSVAAAAAERGVLVCMASTNEMPALSDSCGATTFQTGATVRRGDVCVAVSTGGVAPGLAAAVRDHLAMHVGPEVAEAATMLAGLRERLRERFPSIADSRTERTHAMRGVLGAGLLDLLRSGRRAEAEAMCEAALAEGGAPPAGEGSRCTR